MHTGLAKPAANRPAARARPFCEKEFTPCSVLQDALVPFEKVIVAFFFAGFVICVLMMIGLGKVRASR